MNTLGKKILTKTHIGSEVPWEVARPFVMERLMKRTRITDRGCWEWTGPLVTNGYVEVIVQGTRRRLHKWSYQIHKGEVPDGLDVCHSCDVRHCWNPDHLWVGTRKQNMEDCTKKGRHGNLLKTHCVNGHEFTPDNIDWRPKPSGIMGRHCKACQRERQRRDRIERPEVIRERQRRNRARRKARLQVVGIRLPSESVN